MDQEKHDLQERVRGKWTRVPFAIRLLWCLQFVAKHLNCALDVGVISCGYNSILISIRAFSRFLELSASGINRNFREHGFELDVKANVLLEMERCVPGSSRKTEVRWWSKRVYTAGLFHPGTTEPEAHQVAELASTRRNSAGSHTKGSRTETWALSSILSETPNSERLFPSEENLYDAGDFSDELDFTSE
jgi:hypothetical protein